MNPFWKRNLIFIASLTGLYCMFIAFTFFNNPDRFKTPPAPTKKTFYGVRNKSLPIDLKKGSAVFRIMYEGFNVDMDLLDELGNKKQFYVNDLIEEKYSSRKVTEITEDGKYYIDVKAKGYWSISVEENLQ